MATSTRFDSASYLEAWRTRGRWPEIHDKLADFAVSHVRGSSLLDLGCSYGLLGARIASDAGIPVAVGIELDTKVIEASQAAGVPIRLIQMAITRETLTTFAEVLTENKTDVLIARRILPELWGDDLEGGRLFAETLAACRVREIFLEGRVNSERAVSPLRSIDKEVDLLQECFREAKRSPPGLSYLVLR